MPEASKCFTQLKFSLEGGGEKLCKASNLEGKGGGEGSDVICRARRCWGGGHRGIRQAFLGSRVPWWLRLGAFGQLWGCPGGNGASDAEAAEASPVVAQLLGKPGGEGCPSDPLRMQRCGDLAQGHT